MGDEYLMRGEWTPARAVKAKLLRAAEVLARSGDGVDQAAARWALGSWQAVASRPRDLDWMLTRAAELHREPDAPRPATPAELDTAAAERLDLTD